MTQKAKQSVRKKLEKEGWIFEPYRCYKKVGKREIDIEFCIGDFCLGIFDEDLNLLEPKRRCESFIEAYINSFILEEKYENLTRN